MSKNQSLIAELQHEAVSTRKSLERVKDDSFNFKPHEKSMTMIKLATHLAEISGWVEPTINLDEIDFAKMDYTPPVITNNKELLELFDKSLAAGLKALESASDENLMATWTAKNNGEVAFAMARIQVIRGMIIKHLVHHRAQLGIYLRMTDAPVPATYGPTADEYK